jgi:DnaJ-domain-containing protein 1
VTEPTTIAAAGFFEFIRGNRLAVILVSIHPIHTFNTALATELAADPGDVALGTIELADLITSGGPALRYLHEGLHRCGAPTTFGVLPGYYLFRSGALIGWETGLPTIADGMAIAKSALLGAVWSTVIRDTSFLTSALRFASDQAAGQRVAAVYRYAINNPATDRDDTGQPSRAPVDDVYWAYQVLGVLPTASDREVYEAWRRKRREAHPDLAAGDTTEFERRSRISQDINRARDIIVNYRSGGTRKAS